MQISHYIADLLYRYDCVIVPNFGGFITNTIGTVLDHENHVFYPPTKQLSFNKNLKHNDGLLANYIASSKNISFQKATDFIENDVLDWQKQLQSTKVDLAHIGSLQLNKENQLIFSPFNKQNFLTSSFGLSSIEANNVKRYSEKIIPIVTAKKEEKKRGLIVPLYAKYAASFVILAMLGITGYNGIANYNQQKIYDKKQQKFEEKIQQATFVINTPLPTINLNVEKASLGNYHIIAGAFQFKENAEKKLHQLKVKGFENARIIGKNSWGLTQVTYTSLTNRTEALKTLKIIKASSSKDAWLLIKKIN